MAKIVRTTAPEVGESCILDVPLHYQPGNMLCWAAALIMVIDSVGDEKIDIIEVIIRDREFKKDPLAVEAIENYNEVDAEKSPQKFISNNAQPWNYSMKNNGESYHSFDTILSLLGFYSTEDYTIKRNVADVDLLWDLVVNHIKTQKRPLILIIEANGGSQAHAIVIRGFWKDKNNTRHRYLYVNDPLAGRPFEGEIYSLHFDNLVSSGCCVKGRSMVHSVRKKDDFKWHNSQGKYKKGEDLIGYHIDNELNTIRGK